MILGHLIKLRDRRARDRLIRGYRRKLVRIYAELDPATLPAAPSHLEVSRYRPGYRDARWHVAYAAANGRTSPYYLPEDVFYADVEPSLTDAAYARLYHDKVGLAFLLGSEDNIGFRYFLNRGRVCDDQGRERSREEVAAWAAAQPEVVLKPYRDSGGGRDVRFLPGPEAAAALDALDHDVMLQEIYVQHPDLAALHAGSLNTVRVMTLCRRGGIALVSAVLRMGVGGTRVDNATRGGVICGIVDGRLRPTGFGPGMGFRPCTIHPTSELAFADHPVPSWPAIVDLVERCHRKLLETGIASWDVGVGADGRPRIVEVNVLNQELNFHQLCNGPVFEPYFPDIFAAVAG